MKDLTELENKTIVIVNHIFYETVVHIKNVKFKNDGYFATCIFADISNDDWGMGSIDDDFIYKWKDDIELADIKYKEWMIITIFTGERNDWLLDKE